MLSLVIVCDEKRKKFGDNLQQLISMKDDTDEATIGIKDGSVDATVWTEEQYNTNSPTMSSEQHILFIGNSKMLKDKRMNMKVVFSKYGIKYGSLGKQAFIAVDEVVKKKQYKEFYDYAKKYADDLDEIIKQRRKLKTGEKVGAVVDGVAVGFFTPNTMLYLLAAISAILYAKKNNEIKDQMYSLAVMKFYLDYLAAFLDQ